MAKEKKNKNPFPKKIFVPESQTHVDDSGTTVSGYSKENDALDRKQEKVATYVLEEVRKGKLVPRFKVGE